MPFAAPGDGNGNGPEQWFNALPFITKYWFAATGVLTFSANFGVFEPKTLLLYNFDHIKEGFQLWRLVTSFCYAGPFKFNTLFTFYMMVTFSQQYEANGPYNTGAGGGTADYATCLLFGMALLLLSFPLMLSFFGAQMSYIFLESLSSYVIYVWSRRNPTAPASFWGFPVQAMYLPFVSLLITVLIGNPWGSALHGIMIGHLYYFMVDVYPSVQGKDILRTPRFLINYFGVGEYTPERQQQQQQQRAPPQRRQDATAAPQQQTRGGGGGHNWGGGGRTLGTS
eukprot:CAMPEP_0118691082 /NCGR_PEP_ID=MMETSP0800-20121206/10479_1 /TAXON_ID=210618 ORGANISM="Striatella unipunctata, Strain CCMP2910" /NCGR_SAMPLE_ID=MMETSP0800 /ASSEMBLY_ACC=CAM_ASM_000638 /LENGTH=281 /DNA_ID=CAMNT_0006588815 /DNA_START=18 /DNA_END=863 /DNA_ORIENTATION=-